LGGCRNTAILHSRPITETVQCRIPSDLYAACGLTAKRSGSAADTYSRLQRRNPVAA